jgi:imidazolonepropionase
VDLLVNEMIPAVAQQRLATSCDVFVEESAFSIDEARRILGAAKAAGLGVRLHADQLTTNGAAELAGELRALSADHLEFISERGISALANTGVVAVSLPIASLYLKQKPMPARRLIEAGVAVAVATDFNPGSAPSYHLPLALTLACTTQGMTPAESLKGATLFAARAVGAEAAAGSLEEGKQADFVVLDAPDVNHWLYHFQPNASLMTYIGGAPRWSR